METSNELNSLSVDEGMLEKINRTFSLQPVDLKNYSSLTLAYLGDCVYELIIRTVIVERGNTPVHQMNKKSSQLVKAATQAALIEYLLAQEGRLTEAEEAAYRRGRNGKSATRAKNASLIDYKKATGFEALIGDLYLQGQYDRILYLVRLGLTGLGELL